MAIINNKKPKKMEFSYLRGHKLAFLLFSTGRTFLRDYKEKHLDWMLHWFNKTEQMKHRKLRAEAGRVKNDSSSLWS